MTPTEFVDSFWPLFSLALPFIVAWTTAADGRGWVKFAVAATLAAIAGVVSAAGFDWSTMPPAPELFHRAAAVFGFAHAVYFVVDRRLSAATGRGTNEQSAMAPRRGLR